MDLNDLKAWDDSELISTWDEALEEYKKYHSIHLSGKRLEDVLTKEEMVQVHAQRRALHHGEQDRPLKRYEDEEVVEDDGHERAMSMSPERDIPINIVFEEPQPQEETTTSAELPQPASNGTTTAATLPQIPMAIGIQDENLKNLLMAWYYAGYHTGLYEGRQQAMKELGGDPNT